jgi:hypothetical protein
MKGVLRKLPDGTLAADLECPVWGWRYRLTGVRCEGGYAVEVRLVAVPESLALPGDGERGIGVVK